MSGRQRRGRGGRYQHEPHDASSSRGNKSSSPFEVPILKFGIGSNFAVFKKKIQVCTEKEFKQLAKFFQTNEYFVPPAITAGVQFAEEDLDPVKDPFEFLREEIKQERALRPNIVIIDICTSPASLQTLFGGNG
jgi:hypothetical protein